MLKALTWRTRLILAMTLGSAIFLLVAALFGYNGVAGFFVALFVWIVTVALRDELRETRPHP